MAAFHEVEKLDGVDGAVGEVVECFLGCGGVLLLDEGAEGAALAEVPGFFSVGEWVSDALFESIEVFLLVGGRLGFPAGEFVFRVGVPGKEVEF